MIDTGRYYVPTKARFAARRWARAARAPHEGDMKGTIVRADLLRGHGDRPSLVLVAIEADARPRRGRVAYHVDVRDWRSWRRLNLKPGDRVDFRARDPWHLVRL
jgi:hypothetical protein